MFKPVVCAKHNSSATTSVCMHINESIRDGCQIKIVPVFYEGYILDFYLDKYWLCEICAEGNDIPSGGCVYFDPLLREYGRMSEAEQDDAVEIDCQVIDPLKELKDSLCAVCSECFKGGYGEVSGGGRSIDAMVELGLKGIKGDVGI